MNRAGKPLRVIGTLVGLWIAGRVVWLWPAPAEAEPGAVVLPVSPSDSGMAPVAAYPADATDGAANLNGVGVSRARIALGDRSPSRYAVRLPLLSRPSVAGRTAMLPPIGPPGPKPEAPMPRRGFGDRLGTAASLALMGLGSLIMPQTAPARPQTPPAPGPLPPPRGANRWSASAWLLGRSGEAPPPLATGGQLGGSQFGARLVYRVAGSAAQPVSAFARLSGPVQQRGREAAVGFEAQPFAKVPVRIVAERRIALERGAASGFAVSAVGGGSVALPHGLQLDAYGQAGVIGLKRRAGFVDGAAVVTKEAARLGAIPVRVGAGVWGGAQPGVSRLDVGPRVEAGLPVAGQTVRFAVDWREKVAGNALPGSGPAVTLGADF